MNPKVRQFVYATAALIAGPVVSSGQSQNGPPDHPSVVVRGVTYTPRSILARNRGTPVDEDTQLPPHKIIGNVYYVGTRTLSSYLIVTSAGNILMDSGYEHSVRGVVQKSVTDLGFKF